MSLKELLYCRFWQELRWFVSWHIYLWKVWPFTHPSIYLSTIAFRDNKLGYNISKLPYMYMYNVLTNGSWACHVIFHIKQTRLIFCRYKFKLILKLVAEIGKNIVFFLLICAGFLLERKTTGKNWQKLTEMWLPYKRNRRKKTNKWGKNFVIL